MAVKHSMSRVGLADVLRVLAAKVELDQSVLSSDKKLENEVQRITQTLSGKPFDHESSEDQRNGQLKYPKPIHKVKPDREDGGTQPQNKPIAEVELSHAEPHFYDRKFFRVKQYIPNTDFRKSITEDVEATPIGDVSEESLESLRTQVAFQPLMSWVALNRYLAKILKTNKQSASLDVPKIIHALSRKKLIQNVPYQSYSAWLGRVDILVERSYFYNHLFYEDYEFLIDNLLKTRGRDGLRIISVVRNNLSQCSLWEQRKEFTKTVFKYKVPESVEAVLVLGDLGCYSHISGDAESFQPWAEIGKQCKAKHIPAYALMPVPKRFWQPEISTYYQACVWDFKGASKKVSAPYELGIQEIYRLLVCIPIKQPAFIRFVRKYLPHTCTDVGTEFTLFLDVHHAAPVNLQFEYDHNSLLSDFSDRKNLALQKSAVELLKIFTRQQYEAKYPVSAQAMIWFAFHEALSEELKEELLADDGYTTLLKHHHDYLRKYLDQPKTQRNASGELELLERRYTQLIPKGKNNPTGKKMFKTILPLLKNRLENEGVSALPRGVTPDMLFEEGSSHYKEYAFTLVQEGENLKVVNHLSNASPLLLEWGKGGYFQYDLINKAHLNDIGYWSEQIDKPKKLWEEQQDDILLPAPSSDQLLLIKTSNRSYVVESVSQPGWAKSISQDRHNLKVQYLIGDIKKELVWLPPGQYPIKTDSGHLEYDLRQGYFCSHKHFMLWTKNRLKKPVWASEFGMDQYGIYAVWHHNKAKQRFYYVHPGEFLMGSPDTEAERLDNELLHTVLISEGFWLADTACSQSLWQSVMGENPSDNKESEQHPVENVSWEDCQTFFTKISKQFEGLMPALPSEAQWEYACRAGTQTPFAFDDDLSLKYANYNSEYPYGGGKKEPYLGKTIPVNERYRNAWGFCQMHGNVWEWCYDWFEESYYSRSPIVGPTGPGSGDARVLRGGAYYFYGEYLRSAYRFRNSPTNWYDYIGFRFALVNPSA